MAVNGERVTLTRYTGNDILPLVPALSSLRIKVFREWPYLYEGDAAAEEDYLGGFAGYEDAVLVTAAAGDQIIGASTGSAMEAHHEEFADPLRRAGIDVPSTFYFAESVLLPAWRGAGIGHKFFDAREDYARERGYERACFCAVVRPPDHPARPEGARSLKPFWAKRGYIRLEGVIASYPWRDIGEAEETEKPMQFYMAAL